MDVQQEIDFSRGEQLALLRDARLPAAAGVGAGVLKAVLKAIDDYGRGRTTWVSRATLAASSGFGPRHVSRALAALEAASLIVRERLPCPGGRRNCLRIVWTELAALNAPARGGVAGPRVCDQESRVCDQESRVCDQESRPSEARYEAQEEPPPPPTSSSTMIHEPQAMRDAAAAAARLKAWGLGAAGRLVAAAIERGASLAELRGRIEEALATVALRENRGRFRSPPGAVAHFVLEGAWPVDHVISPAEAATRRRAAAQRARSAPAAGPPAESLHEALRRLEAAHGAALDALPPSARDALSAAAIPPGGPPLPARLRRLCLLKHFAAVAATQEIAP